MKKAIVAIGFVYLLSGCEDGPKQTFTPSPAGAGSRWNDGQTPPITDSNINQSFVVTETGTNLQEICDAPTKKARWAAAFAAPITPPRKAANIDLAGDDTWKGITVSQAEQINCQSTNYDSTDNYWGDNGEVFFAYSAITRKLWALILEPGYTGSINFHSRDNAHQYEAHIGGPITKDGMAMQLDWNGGSAPCTIAGANGICPWVNELGDALLATFAPGLPAETDCRTSGHCIVVNFGDEAGLYIPAIGWDMRVASFTAAQPTPSTISAFLMYYEKLLPFSVADTTLKMDAEGPKAIATKLGPNQKTCQLNLGMTYQNLLDDCVEVSGDPTADQAELNKLIGGLSHSSERYHFDVSGVDIALTAKDLADDNVLRDTDRPAPTDFASDFDVDQSTLGKITNDYLQNNPGLAKDLHMTGLIYAEYVTLVQNALNAALPTGVPRHYIGDPACLPGIGGTMADGCTGFEGFVIPTNSSRIDDPDNHLQTQSEFPLANAPQTLAALRSGMKPGHQSVTFCETPGLKDCDVTGDTFITSYNRMVSIYAKGDKTNLPPEMKDDRFFFRLWAIAFFKFLMAEKPDGSTTWSQVHASQISYDDIFFDSQGSGQWEVAEYVDRRFVVSNSQDPTDVVITADVINGIVNDYDFGRDLIRGETALYLATRANNADPIGKEASLLTNLIGSPLITNGWANEGGSKTAYACATDVTGALGCNAKPPMDVNTGLPMLDEAGNPIMTKYQGAFSATGTVFKLGGTSELNVTTSDAYAALQTALVTVPIHQNTYDLTTPVTDTKKYLIPWLPKQPGVGFPIALSGTRDKFIDTATLDLSGLTESVNLDYDLVDPNDPSKGITLKAVETTDFLGYTFLCLDASTNDLLAVKMYTPAANVLDWVNKHPDSVNSCGIVVRYSPYNNFPDYITSLTNGVRLGITQGGGFGRVVDVTLFAPGQ